MICASWRRRRHLPPRGAARGGPLLKVTNATPDRIGALATILRQPEPPLYAIGRMYYVPDKAALAWNDIWIALQEGWDRLPETTRQQADAIAGQLASEAQAAAPGKDFQAAHERALKALEQIPEVVRAIAPAFLKCKTVDQPDPRRSADLGWSGRGGARAEGPAAAPVEPEAFGGDGEESEKLRIDFFTDIRFPQKVKQAETQWLTVRLTLQPPADSIATTMATVEFAKKKDEPPPPEVVEVRVTAPDFSEVTGDWARTITVYYDRDSQPAVFLLTSDLPGTKRVTVDFYHKGRMIGSAKFLTEVHAGATVRAPAPMERAAQFVPLEANPPAPADLELRVTKARDRQPAAVHPQLLAAAGAVPCSAHGRSDAEQQGPHGFPHAPVGPAQPTGGHGLFSPPKRGTGGDHPGDRHDRRRAVRTVDAAGAAGGVLADDQAAA